MSLGWIAGLAIAIATVLAAYARTLSGGYTVMRRIAVDDWRGARDEAQAIVSGARRVHTQLVDHAAVMLVIAHEVLGDYAAARRAATLADQRDLPRPLRASLVRQVASLDRMSGDRDAALARLAQPEATSQGDEWGVDSQLALLHLGDGDGPAAERHAARALARIEPLLRGALTPPMRRAHEADLVQVRCMLVRAQLLQGDLEGASQTWAGCTGAREKPYVQGQVAETGARLAWAQGDRDGARRLAQAAVDRYAEVGASVDVVRARVLLAGYAGDRTAIDVGDAELRAAGALGYLGEVERARRVIDL